MIVYFADRAFNILGMATSTGQGLDIYDDKIIDIVDTGGANFSARIPFSSQSRKEVEKCIKVGNYILYKDDVVSTYFTIIDSELESGRTKEAYFYAEEAGLDLLNEIALPYEANQAYPITHYINQWIGDTGFVVGVNEVSNLTRKLKWEGQDTLTKRILSIATQFDNAEIGFSFDVKELMVTKKYINIYKERGQDNNVSVRIDCDVDKIVTKETIENLATALYVTGGTPEGANEPITLNGYKYDDGRFHNQGPWLKDRESVKLWSRYLAKTETGDGTGHIMGTYSYDTTSQSELCNRAIAHLKKVSQPEVNYEVDIAILPKDVRIGDRINVVDREGELYLSARVLKLERSSSLHSGKATLGEYLIRESGISQTVQQLADQFATLAKNRIRYTWTAYADSPTGSGITLNPIDKSYMGIASNQLVDMPDISEPSKFVWSKIKGDDGKDAIDSGSQLIFNPNWERYHQDTFDEMGWSRQSGTVVIAPESDFPTSNILKQTISDRVILIYCRNIPVVPGTLITFRCQLRTTLPNPNSIKFLAIRFFAADKSATANGVVDTVDGNCALDVWQDGRIYKHAGIAYSSAAVEQKPTGEWREVEVTVKVPGGASGMKILPYSNTATALASSYSNEYRLLSAVATSIGVSKVETLYYHSTSATSLSGGAWDTTRPIWESGKYVWIKTRTTYTDTATSESEPVCVTGEKGSPGNDGEKGEPGADGQDGADGIGIKSADVSYAFNQSGTEVPTEGWRPVPPATPNGFYLWTRTTTIYTDDSVSTSYSVSRNGTDGGSGIIVSTEEPENPELNQLWQYTTGSPIMRWNGTYWVLHHIAGENLDVVSLSAVSTNLGTVTAGKIKNAADTVYFDVNTGEISSRAYDDGVILNSTQMRNGELMLQGRNSSGENKDTTSWINDWGWWQKQSTTGKAGHGFSFENGDMWIITNADGNRFSSHEGFPIKNNIQELRTLLTNRYTYHYIVGQFCALSDLGNYIPVTGFAVKDTVDKRVDIHLDAHIEAWSYHGGSYNIFNMALVKSAIRVSSLSWNPAFQTRVMMYQPGGSSYNPTYWGRTGLKIKSNDLAGDTACLCRCYANDLNITGGWDASHGAVYAGVDKYYQIDIWGASYT